MQLFRFVALQLGSPTACLVFSHPQEKVLLNHTLARLGVLYNPSQILRPSIDEYHRPRTERRSQGYGFGGLEA